MKTLIRHLCVIVTLMSSAWALPLELVGKWKSTDGKETTEFTSDGRVTTLAGSTGVEGKYECKGDTIFLRFDGSEAPPLIERKYKVDNDSLKLEDPLDHRISEFRRVKEKKD